MSPPIPLPIDRVLPELLDALVQHPRALLEAPPGAGKTTRVPLALLCAPWLCGRKVLMLEPRRIATRAAAAFMAAQCGEEVGQRVGYRIRFESKVSPATRIEVVTEGILTRMIQDDPELSGIGAIIFDEFHERHLQGDLGAALALDVQANLRPDLRLLVMSATLEGERIARWFDAPRIVSEGRSFPVRVTHPPARAGEAFPESGWPFHLRRAVEMALAENPGDVLAFLPGKREIQRAAGALAGLGGGSIEIVPLHGELGLAAQQAALAAAPEGIRRVVLATNVAESSVTLPGVRAVVDLGQAREPRFDPNSGFTRLATVAISRASAEQRAGRAGRLGPGTCYRLWPESRRLEPGRRPEIAQVELSRLALELAAWGSDELPWPDPPPAGALAQARGLLQRLGALDSDGRLAAFGRDMLAFGAEPRLAAAVLRAPAAQRGRACDLVALVEARNPLRGAEARGDDFRRRLQALEAWRERRPQPQADAAALAAIQQAAIAWRRRARLAERAAIDDGATSAGDLLLHAYPDRIARQDAGDPRRYTLANGRGVRLAEDSALLGEPWLVVIDLRQEPRDSLVLAAAPLDPARLEQEFPSRFTRGRRLAWNAATNAVEAFEEQRFDAIVLERRAVPVRSEEALPALLLALRGSGLAALPWTEHARELRARVETLRRACPEAGLPDFSDAALLATLEDWLAPHLAGKRRLDQVSAAELSGALAARLDFAQRRRLDAEAPAAVPVPSGLERRIAYAFDAPPVLAVKLQELFGLADTPRIAGGRLPLTLHLLSPGGKPVQVTQDLRSFWERTYPEVKKELKGRYPKHPWPDDPWTATPTHRAKPRR
ncbi:MAG: ATP-dependent helicase HrpB [Xanthomonadales bacterium]|nr:ATP-dependent helicase HrpB [Xanthomonadales bacterium]